MTKEKKFFVQVKTRDLAKEWTRGEGCLTDLGPFLFLPCDEQGVHQSFNSVTKFFTPLQILKRVYMGEDIKLFFEDKPPT